jgi:osmotically-inducible protein OsmY
MNDKQLRLIITDELDFEPSVDASHINVAVADGVVTLTGHVRSHAEKRAAKKAACRVKSVRFVTEQIEVSSPAGKTVDDAEIARRSRNTLAWDARVPSGVKVEVKKGRVELSGKVDWHYQRQAAESAIGRLSGVVDVLNRIELRPCADAAYDIGKAIEAALHRSAELEASAIRVILKNHNMVTLEGKVGTWLERSVAERAAWSAPGVLAVEDQLLVS